MTQLFISHSSKNNAEALALSQWLMAEGWDDQFLDIDPQRGIVGGERWERALHQAAGRCDAVLFLVSPDWLQSEWCRREFTIAQGLGKRLFVLLLDGAKRADVEASMKEIWQLVDLSSGDDHTTREVTLPDETRTRHVYFSRSALMRLRAGLQKAGLDPQSFPWPPSDEPNRAPYRGLAPLEAQDAGIFFGREAPITELLAQLRGLREAAPPRFLTILGASGAGKSSFLRAGILLRLARDDRHFLPLPVIRPERAVLSGSNGLVECLWSLRRERTLHWSRRQIEEAVATGASALQALLQELAQQGQVPEWDGSPPQSPTLVLAIDQAEELFQAEGAEQAGRFLSLLAELLQVDTPKLIVLCTIRSDSYEPLQSAPALADITQRVFSLPPMPHGAFRQVIEAPVALLKHSTRPLRIEPQLTEALLRDIAEGGAKDALPLLAFTLERLYVDYSADGLLSLKDYQDLGRIAGAIEKAVAAALDQAQRNPKLPNDRDECLKLLRRGLIPWMAGIDPRTNLPYRKVALLSQVPEEARALIEHFVEFRLLAKDKNAEGEITIEPAHEALLRQWTTLKGWLEEDTAALATLESVKAASRDWDANKRSPEWLTHAAGRLEDAQALNQRAELAANFGQIDRRYLEACRLQENQRQQQELRLFQSLAEQRQRTVKRTRLGLITASVLLVVATVAALFAWRAQQQVLVEKQQGEATLKQAAERALGRAREQLLLGQRDKNIAYLAESVGFYATVAANEAALTTQQAGSARLYAELTHNDSVGFAAFSLDGTRVVTASRDGTARVWDAQNGRAISAPLKHEKGVLSAAFSPDGMRVLTRGWDNTRIWDSHSGQAIGDPIPHVGRGFDNTALFSPDGRQLAAVSASALRIWDAHSGKAIGVPLQHGFGRTVSYSPDGRQLLTVSGNTVRIWDAQSGQALIAPLKHRWMVNSASYSPDGTRVVTASEHIARIWDARSGQALVAPLKQEGRVLSAAFSPDGTRVVTASVDGTARIWDAQTGQEVSAPLQHDFPVSYAAFSPDGTRVVTTNDRNTVRMWDMLTGQLTGVPLQHERRIDSVAFGPDGRRVVTTSDRTVRIWDAESGQAISSPLKPAASSRDGTRLVTTSFGVGDSAARLWEAQSRKPLGVPLRHSGWVNSAAFSADGTRVVTTGKDGTAILWETQSGKPLGVPIRHSESVNSATFSPNGKHVVTAGADGTARIWDVQSGQAIGAPLQHGNWVYSAAFSPDGMHVVTSSKDETARIWVAQTGQPIGALLQHKGEVYSAAFSPDGTRIVTASEDGTGRIWDAQSGQALGAPLEHESNMVVSAAFSSDGTRVVTATTSGARIWDAESGQALGALLEHDSGVTYAAFSPDGTLVVTARIDGTVHIWDARSGQPLGAPLIHEGWVRSAQFSPDGSHLVTASDGAARIWDVQSAELLGAPITPDELVALCGVLVGDSGQLESLSGLEWMAVINRVMDQAERGATKKDQLMRWHFADPTTRTISPFSQITVPQHIEREINWVLEHPQTEKADGPNYSPKILDDAYNLDPGHPLILLALSVFETRPETKALWKRLSFPRFEKDARLAVRAAEILLIDKDPENARKAAELALKLPTAADADKARAQAVIGKIEEGN